MSTHQLPGSLRKSDYIWRSK